MPSSRHGQLNLAAILSSQSHTIDLHLPAYEDSARNFSQAITDFSTSTFAAINQRREAHDTNMKRLAERAQDMEKTIKQCKKRDIELTGVLEREREETEEAESSVASFRLQVASQQEAVAGLDAEIAQYRARVAKLRKERDIERQTLAKHATLLSAELRAYERVLGCTIEGVGPEQLLIRYSIKGGEGLHEASFVLDVSSLSYYKVSTPTPLLPTLPTLLDRLNESRDVYTFIKTVRQASLKMFS